MSQEFMDPELFSDFIVEAKEHLETIEPNLLELEKAPGNLDLLNDIFRPMHSLKGASGFLGLNRINHLAHKAENILDELRKGSMVITSEIMDVILTATDALRQMIDNLESTSTEGDVAIEPIGELIDAIMRGETPAARSAASPEAPATGDAVASEEPNAGEDMTLAGESPNMSQRDWILALESLPTYTLTAFGEGHLKDFIDEAREITESLTAGLLDIERNGGKDPELVNDLFRYFHNLKGNSGIIGFQELNSLTHEAETLLNRVRHGEMVATEELVDLLLLVVDATDCLVDRIDPVSGTAQPYAIDEILVQLQQAVAGGEIALPEALRSRQTALANNEPEAKAEPAATPEPVVIAEPAEQTVAPVEEAVAPVEEAVAPVEELAPPKASSAVAKSAAKKPAKKAAKADSGKTSTASKAASSDLVAVYPVGAAPDEDDVSAFSVTVQQQQSIIRVALDTLEKDGSQKEYVDALYRCLVAIQNASGFMKLESLRVYAERTASLVNQARNSDMDFSLMVDLLNQEVSIIGDMVTKEVARLRALTVEAGAPVEGAPALAEETPPVTPPAPKPALLTSPEAAKPSKGKTAASPKSKPSSEPATSDTLPDAVSTTPAPHETPTPAPSTPVTPTAPVTPRAPKIPSVPIPPASEAAPRATALAPSSAPAAQEHKASS
ncbi:MAG: Hpt domain-containing protein, partial [Bilophila sp.]